jgi:hypothetical protein
MLTPLQYGGHLLALLGEPMELKKLVPAVYRHWWAIFEPQKILFIFVTITQMLI